MFAHLAARAVFESLFFLRKQLIYNFLAFAGGMKFATQISPPLNFILQKKNIIIVTIFSQRGSYPPTPSQVDLC